MTRTALLIGLCATFTVVAVQAQVVREDVLLIERVEASHDMRLPNRGQLMNQVEAQFGAPVMKHAAVGGDSKVHPPITRWDYREFSVYFENNHVVNSVVRKASPLETGPKPVG